MQILLLEDDADLASSVQRALEATGYGVTHFRTVGDAMAAIPPIGYDVLLCDYELPDGTGLDFIAAVTKYEYRGTTILWSGLDRENEVRQYGLGEAIDHLLIKSDIAGALNAIAAAA